MRWSHPATWGRSTAVVAGAALVVTACSAQPAADGPEVAEAWRVQIDRDLARGHLGELAREVLADYWVTDEEYARARAPIPGCLAERGFIATLPPDGGLEVAADPTHWGDRDLEDPEVAAAGEAAIEACENGSEWIGMYYWDMRSNPEAWDYWEALARCAERLGLTEAAGMATEEIRVAVESSDDFLRECRWDPWSLAHGRPPVGGGDQGDSVPITVEMQG